jgi:hypothetical protein
MPALTLLPPPAVAKKRYPTYGPIPWPYPRAPEVAMIARMSLQRGGKCSEICVSSTFEMA